MQHDYPNPLNGPFLAPFLVLRSWLDSLSDGTIWRIVIGSMVAIAIANFFAQAIGIRLGPLYLLPVSLACWRLNLQIGLGLAFLAALAVAITTCIVSQAVPIPIALGNLGLNTFALGMIAGIVAAARHSMERERIFARSDGVTGTLTRRAFEQKAGAMMKAATMQDRPLLLAYLDIDGFKVINDRYGHEAGDVVLKHLSTGGREILRQEDCFGRMGGDEFAVLMAVASIEAAGETADALHQRFATALMASGRGATCSMGALIVLPGGKASLQELLCEADRLMYAAKHGGKNGLRFSGLAPSLEPDLPLFAGLAGSLAPLRQSIQP